ncbi:MAG: helix-turn-helix transcriptional regulator [Lachnospiraceae bacterium]|jgi:transcriptional regulator with XRE-family HTH domain|nr:helix-turn-helix transcriptional regulator [Lachnospiraceae bacterium]
MDQIKIGRFLAACRKEKDLTQRQLAELLHVSDKTVSKWETGKGLPEAQLMLPLCEALGISVNELLSGERLTETEYQRKAEENMVNLIEGQKGRQGVGSGVKTGIGFGAALAMVLSYHTYTSVWLAILHGILGWVYVVYHMLRF